MAYDSAATQPAKAPTGLRGHARAFLQATGYEPSFWAGAHSARAHLHDTCWHCTSCDDWFASKADMAEEDDCWGWDEVPCHWCRWNLRRAAA